MKNEAENPFAVDRVVYPENPSTRKQFESAMATAQDAEKFRTMSVGHGDNPSLYAGEKVIYRYEKEPQEFADDEMGGSIEYTDRVLIAKFPQDSKEAAA